MRKITIIGGDGRFRLLEKMLREDGYITDTIGHGNDGDIASSDIVILPLPATKDGVNIFSPLCEENLPIEKYKKLCRGKKVLSGGLKFNDDTVDYAALDSLALLNAVPTAEGAIAYTIDHTDFTLWKSKVLVLGYGRVGRILADRLKALGAYVTVAAGRESSLAELDAGNFPAVKFGELENADFDFDIIYNTVDKEFLAGKQLEKARLIIDLSTKGGFCKADTERFNIVKLPALPGKTAPKTAGEILHTVLSTLID